MTTGVISRGLSQLPVVPGKEAEVLNREVNPMIRELRTSLAATGALVDEAAVRLSVLEAEIDALQLAMGDFTGLGSAAPSSIQAGSSAEVGTSTKGAHEDHVHSILTGPATSIGGANTEGSGPALARANHSHLLQESSGPTNLPIGAVLDGELMARIGSSLAGRQLETANNLGTVSTTSGTLVDATAALNFAIKHGGAGYLGVWVLGYTTQGVGNGLLLSLNFTGTAGTQRYGVMIGTGATAMYSAWESTNFDVPLGNPTVGPGGTARLALLFCRVAPSTPGDVVLRFASGVAGQSVTIANRSFAWLLQQ